MIEDYLHAEKEPLRDEILDLLGNDKSSLLERKKMGDGIWNLIKTFVEKFIEDGRQ